MARNRFETEYENITFNFTVIEYPPRTMYDSKGEYFNWGEKENGEERMLRLPFHNQWYKVRVTFYDEESQRKAYSSFYLPIADWISAKERREYVMQIVCREIVVPEHILGDGESCNAFWESVAKVREKVYEALDYNTYEGF